MKKILVVVDMQNDFIDGPLGTPEARAIVDNVCAKIREGEWDLVYSTQDSHDHDYLETQEGKKLPIKHCITGSSGWYINDKVWWALNERDFNELFKNSFGDRYIMNDILQGVLNTKTYFNEKEIELTLVGVCTDICVISNALLLKAHYPEMKIVVDASCCAGSTPEKHYMALEVMKSCQVDVINNEWVEIKKDISQVVGKAFGIPEEFWTDGNEIMVKHIVGENEE